MLHRQKALLFLLQQVGAKASSLQMMKWAFLLAQEAPFRGGKTFYQFVPYRFGPYSFTLDRESESLIRNGYLYKLNNSWILTSLAQGSDITLPKSLAQDTSYIVKKYGNLTGKELVDFVYEKYQWFTVNSQIISQKMRPIAQKAIYTIGYEGKTVDEFLNRLMMSGIVGILDVRYNPISRRYGFHKSTLMRLCSQLKIDYQHFPQLGIPGSKREDLCSIRKYNSLFENYRNDLPSHEDDLFRIISLLNTQPSVLVCMEADHQLCHRGILAQYLKTMVDLPIIHL